MQHIAPVHQTLHLLAPYSHSLSQSLGRAPFIEHADHWRFRRVPAKARYNARHLPWRNRCEDHDPERIPCHCRRTLLHPSNGGFDGVNVRPQVPPIGSSACSRGDLGAARSFFVAEPWIITDAVFEVADAGRFRRSDHDVSFGKGPASGNDQVLIEFKGVKAGLQNGFSASRLALGCTTFGTSTRRGYRLPPISDGKHAVGQGEVWQFRSVVQNREHNAGDKPGYVINLDVMHWWLRGDQNQEGAAALEIFIMQAVGEEVVNAVTSAVGGRY